MKQILIDKSCITNILAQNGTSIVKNVSCTYPNCYGRGYISKVEDKQYEFILNAVRYAKEKMIEKEMPVNDWTPGQYIQCPKCYKWYMQNRHIIDLEELNKLGKNETGLQLESSTTEPAVQTDN